MQPNGSRWWRFDYRRPGTGKRNTLSLGTYPDVSLKQARTRRDDTRKLLADGIDPADKRKAEAVATADTFEAVAREWYATQAGSWVPAHGDPRRTTLCTALQKRAADYAGSLSR